MEGLGPKVKLKMSGLSGLTADIRAPLIRVSVTPIPPNRSDYRIAQISSKNAQISEYLLCQPLLSFSYVENPQWARFY